MNSAQLIAHFDRISEAPNAIPRLRRFILDLAVRGKLVEQDPYDEGASAARTSFLSHRAGGVTQNDLADDAWPDKIPSLWKWHRLGSISERITDGEHATPPRIQEHQVPLVTAKNVRDGFMDYGHTDWVSFETAKKAWERCRPVIGDVLLVCVGATTGRLCVLREAKDMVLVRSVALIRPNSAISVDYLAVALRSPMCQAQIWGKVKMTAQPCLYINRINSLPIPLPPLAEQHRIVAKLDELMALCDRLEAAQAERENRQNTLVAATLHHLNNGGDAESFREYARFYFNHLPGFTAHIEHIKHLRQTIVSLAVRGQLVPQDTHDEPASEQLDRIYAEKARRVKEAKIKWEKPLSGVAKDEEPFVIPARWEWVRLGALTQLITKGSSPRWQGVQYVSKEHGVLFVTSENVGNYRLRKMDEPKYVEERFNEIEPRSILQFGDILMNLVGASIGRTAIYDLSDNANINQAVALVRLLRGDVSLCVKYLLHYFNSPLAVEYMLSSRVVTAQPNMSLTDAREFPVPIPPFAEQKRIVAKVDDLMAVCDRLEAQLATTKTESRRLLEAVLHHALNDSRISEPAFDACIEGRAG